MTKKLKEEDRVAVDLMLDRSAVASSLPAGFAAPSHAADNRRVNAASRVLHVLDGLVVGDPPADLISRTMRRIDRATAGMHDAHRPATYVPRQQPLM